MTHQFKTALVVGGNGGVGSEAIISLLSQGYFVYGTFRENSDRLKEISKVSPHKEKFKYMQLDCTSLDDVKNGVREILNSNGNLDVIILSISEEYVNIRIFDLEWANISSHINSQVKSLYNLYKALEDQIKSEYKTKFITILSDVCIGVPPKGFSHYTTSKYALMGLSKCLSAELSSYNSTVNMISPGMVETDLLENLPKKLIEISAFQNPLKRNGDPKDISALIGFLASDSSDYLNGVNIPLNGGSKLI